jgi:type IV fimbrial biogenesis protein FimT
MEWIQNTRIRTVAESLQNGLQVARSEAVRRNMNVEFILQNANGGWLVQLQEGAVFVQRSAGEGGANVTVTANPQNTTTVTFNGMGRVRPTNAGGTAPFTRLDFDLPATIMPANKTHDLRLTISVGGEIRMCDPGTTLPDDDPRRC